MQTNKFLVMGIGILAVAGLGACSDQGLGLFGYSSTATTFTVDRGGDGGIVIDPPSDGSVVDELPGSIPSGEGGGGISAESDDPLGIPEVIPAPDPGSDPSDDDDGDGIVNEDDDISDLCVAICIQSHGASSARISLNGSDIFSPSDFHNQDFSMCRSVNLLIGSNSVISSLAGSPGDSLDISIRNCSVQPNETLCSMSLERTNGQPVRMSCSF